jgi:hypothetical protein
MIQYTTKICWKVFSLCASVWSHGTEKRQHVGEYRNDGNIYIIHLFVLQKLILENACDFESTPILSMIIMGWHEGNLNIICKEKHCKGSLFGRPQYRWKNANGFIPLSIVCIRMFFSFGGRGEDKHPVSMNYMGTSNYVSSLMELMRQNKFFNCLLLLSAPSPLCLFLDFTWWAGYFPIKTEFLT